MKQRLLPALMIGCTAALLLGFTPQVWCGDPPKKVEQTLNIDKSKPIDPLSALFLGVEPTPIQRDWRNTARSGKARAGSVVEEVPDSAQTLWRKALWNVTEAMLKGEKPEATGAVTPTFSFFPGSGENTYFWLTVPVPAGLPADAKLIALLRPKNEENSFALGTDKTPFEVRETANGSVAQTARDLPPGSYLLTIGTVGADGKVLLRYAGEQLIVRMPQTDLKASSVILADSLKADAEATQGAFRASGFSVVPRPTRVFKVPDTLRLFYIVAGAGAAADGQPDFDVTYQFHAKQPSGWVKAGRPVALPHRRGAAQAWETDLVPAFPAGEFKVEIQIKDNVGGGVINPEVLFTVTK